MVVGIKIMVFVGCRSDEGLTSKIIKLLQEADWCECHKIELITSTGPLDVLYIGAFDIANNYIRLIKPDLVLCTGDRTEMAAAAQASFTNNIKIAHFYAGCMALDWSTHDDTYRHIITLLADIALCESYEAVLNVWKLWDSIGKKGRVFIVGNSHLDDLEFDDSLVPPYAYNLVLINKATKLKEKLPDFNKENTIIIGPNPDGEVDLEPTYRNIPRAQYLSLLKNCNKFYSNSSDVHYIAPHFLKPEQIIQIGARNKNRQIGKIEPGASYKIVEILEEMNKDLYQ